MGSTHERLERQADRRLERQQRHDERSRPSTMKLNMTITRPFSRPSGLPEFDMPMPIEETELELLGERRGRRYYASKRYKCEFVAGAPVTDPPNRLLFRGTEGTWIPLTPVESGSFAAPWPTTAARPKASRPVDALDGLSLLDGRRETIIAPPNRGGMPILGHGDTEGVLVGPEVRGRVIAGRGKIRGAGPILARLRSKGANVTLSTDREDLVTTSPAGRAYIGVADVVEHPGVRRLLLAYLRGEPLACTVSAHGGNPPEAVTLTLGGAAWCGSCRPS